MELTDWKKYCFSSAGDYFLFRNTLNCSDPVASYTKSPKPLISFFSPPFILLSLPSIFGKYSPFFDDKMLLFGDFLFYLIDSFDLSIDRRVALPEAYWLIVLNCWLSRCLSID